MNEKVVKFLRQKDLILKQELGHGACGRTVLLYDDVIEEHFVCKKYEPIHVEWQENLFNNFVREIKLLHILNHENVVRVFNYYLYPEKFLGYILMEYIQGADIEDYLAKHPENINEIFVQVIEGFAHLEKHKILHRDIRPQNIMVTDSSIVKIIDFGFGKQTFSQEDFGKSITLNWWCEPPSEFKQAVYDYKTEVYFVGKLFQKIIVDGRIESFKHINLLGNMCALQPESRAHSFTDVRKGLLADKFLYIDFNEWELRTYRDFSNSLFNAVSKIEQSTKYFDDVVDIQSRLEECYKKVMLEEHIPNNSVVLKCFINGTYYYSKQYRFRVDELRTFLDFFRSSFREKKNIIIGNIQTKLDAVELYNQEVVEFDDDIPF